MQFRRNCTYIGMLGYCILFMLTYGTEITRSHIEHYNNIIEVNCRGNNVVHQAQFVLCIVII